MLRFMFNSIFRPAKKPEKISVLRYISRTPILFDIISLLLQSKNFKRVSDITETIDLSAHHKKVFSYNSKVTKTKVFTMTRRAEKYYSLSVQPIGDYSTKKLLIVGPRNIQEFFHRMDIWIFLEKH